MRTRAIRTWLVLLATGVGICGPGLAWHAMAPAIEYREAHADITYVYDALGRLVGVVDPAGDTGVYQYDAVGNLTGIARYASATVGIIAVAPGTGSVGAGVTISGTGFSPTPGQNAVTFNGTSATVTASTATQIVTTVPAGATTGSIAVTAPTGSATSPSAFTVVGPGAPTSTSPPTITSFTPSVGNPGTAVTISGTNFEPVPTRNHLNFYHARAAVGTASATTLGVTVPVGATSGRLTVANSAGAAQSGDDFFVPPLGFPAADVFFTGRIVMSGSSLVVPLSIGNAIGVVVFDGTAGQVVSLGVPQIPVNGWDSSVTIFRPDGSTAVSQFIGYGAWNQRDLHIASLPVAGTYSILVDIWQSYGTGNFTLSLSEDLAPVPLTVGGSPLALTVSRPGQRTPLTFTGTTGQRLTLGVTTALISRVVIAKPDGAPLTSDWSKYLTTVNLPPLPATGTYTIYLDPYYAATGTMTVTLSEEVTGTIAINGATVPLTLPRAGERARLSFNGTAGQRLNLGLTDSTILSGTALVIRPDGSTLASLLGFGGGNTTLDLPPLPVTGTYVILLDPNTYDNNGSAIGSTDRKSQVTSRTYDVLDRLAVVTFADASTITYTYDAGHRVTQIADSLNGTITRSYDGLDRLTQEITPQGTVSYTYDAAGRRATMTVTGQATVSYTYDTANRLTQIQQDTNTMTLGYDNVGRRTSLTLPNGVTTISTYDAASHLTDLTYTVGATTLGTLSYTYDANDNRIQLGGTWARTGIPTAISGAAYNAANQQVAFNGQAQTFDLNGNLTSDETRAYTWNARDELLGLTRTGLTAAFAYDGTGRRESSTINGTQTARRASNAVQETDPGGITTLLAGLEIDAQLFRTDASGSVALLTDALALPLGSPTLIQTGPPQDTQRRSRSCRSDRMRA